MPPKLQTIVLAAAVAASVIGCKSVDKAGSNTFAAVRISGHTPEQIRGATLLEFEQEGFTPAEVKLPQMVFEREGSRWDQIAYGGWMTKNVWVRVKVSVVPINADTSRLECQAFRVRDKGEPLEAEPVPLRHSQSKPYQALLDKIAARLAR